jgi:hypothetical protein
MVAIASKLKPRLQRDRRSATAKGLLNVAVWFGVSFGVLCGVSLAPPVVSLAVAQATTDATPVETVKTPWSAFLPAAQIIGEGQFRRWGFLVYDATLWSSSGQYEPDQPFALSLTYARTVSREQIVDASLDEMRELGVDVDGHPEWSETLRNVFVDVSEGDTLTGIYMPDQGAVFYADDRLTGQVSEDLAQAFFAIWLDPDTTAPDLRLALLGKDQ